MTAGSVTAGRVTEHAGRVTVGRMTEQAGRVTAGDRVAPRLQQL